MQSGDVVIVGELIEDIVMLWSDQPDGNRLVVLTGRQRSHYLDRHPEIREFEGRLSEAVLDPDEVHRNKRDPQMALFYKRLNERHYLRVAVLMQRAPGALRHSILSVRLSHTSEVMKGEERRVWAKK